MRKKGNTLEFIKERRDELFSAIRAEGTASSRFDLLQACRHAVSKPASRFWVSEERATRVLAAMAKGGNFGNETELSKRRMYEEINRRVSAIRPGRENEPLVNIVREVVYEPAPEHYISPITAMNMYYGHLRTKHKTSSNGHHD